MDTRLLQTSLAIAMTAIGFSACSSQARVSQQSATSHTVPVVSKVSLEDASHEVVLREASWQVLLTCRQIQTTASSPVLCPTRLPEPVLPQQIGSVPAALIATAQGTQAHSGGIAINYGAPYAATNWRTRPCCFLHFTLERFSGPPPPGLTRLRLGGYRGWIALPESRGRVHLPCFQNHVCFLFRREGVTYIASLHDFGDAPTTRLLGRILEALRPVSSLPSTTARTTQTSSVAGRTLAADQGRVWAFSVGDTLGWIAGHQRIFLPTARVLNLQGEELREMSFTPPSAPVESGLGSIWVPRGHTVERIDARTGHTIAVLVVHQPVIGVSESQGTLWVVTSPSRVVTSKLLKVDPQTLTVTAKVDVPGQPSALAASATAVWVLDGTAGTAIRLDPRTLHPNDRVTLTKGAFAIASDGARAWVTNPFAGTVTLVGTSPRHARPTSIYIGGNPYGVVYAAHRVWVANLGARAIDEIDAGTDRLTRRLPIAGDPLAIAYSAGHIFAIGNSDGAVTCVTDVGQACQ